MLTTHWGLDKKCNENFDNSLIVTTSDLTHL